MTSVRASHRDPSGWTLSVIHGDLTHEHTDAIVNAANGHLAHGGGVAAAIVRRGGASIQRESDAWIAEHGPIPTGAVAVTGAGSLPCRTVIHAVGPIWNDGADDEENQLRSAVRNSLEKAHEIGLKSIALPAISSGIFGFPKPLCAKIFFDETLAFFARGPDSSLRAVRFTNFDAPTVEVFLAEFRTRFGVAG